MLNLVIAYTPGMTLGSSLSHDRMSTAKALLAISKKAETYIKVKRLKQMISDGKGYQGYVDEMKKYGKPTAEDSTLANSEVENTIASADSDCSTSTTLNPVDVKKKLISIGLGKSDPVEVMKKVLKYQQDKIDAQKLGDRSTVMEATDVESSEAIRKDVLQGAQQSEKRVNDQISETNVDVVYRIAFLPDTGVDEGKRNFYSSLSGLFEKSPCVTDLDAAPALSIAPLEEKMISSNGGDASMCRDAYSLSFLSMPDVYMSNTKRHEQLWIEYMRTLDLSKFHIVLAHGSSSEALLRYMESETVERAVLIDASDIYTAGERHGRAFRYSLIAANCHSISFLSTTQRYTTESSALSDALRPYCSDENVPLSIVSSSAHCDDQISVISAITSAIADIVRT